MFAFFVCCLSRSAVFHYIMTTYTQTEQDKLLQLPEAVQRILEEYPSVAENYLRASLLPTFPETHQFGLFEVYYDGEDVPALAVKDAVFMSTPRETEADPTIIEVMGDEDVVFIEVADAVILKRISGDLPAIDSIGVKQEVHHG